MILCCQCGIEIAPNSKNMCERCYSNKINFVSSVTTSMIVETCRGCERYHSPPKSWKSLAWGSKDLLIFLLNKNKSLKKLNIIDSNFVYSEESSKKIRIEILILQDFVEQTCVIEYAIRNKQCSECMRAEAKQYWKACVQVRQKPHHKRTFIHLEQLIMAHKAHLKTSNIKERKDGIDFFFGDRTSAIKLVDFINGFYGIKTIASHQLISEDCRNNTANKKFTFSVELVPFCKDDLVYCEHKPLGLGPFVTVTKAANSIIFTDPRTNKSSCITAKQYFIYESNFKILLRSDRFKHYRVIYARETNDGLFEATITEDDIVFHDVTTHFKIKDDDVICCYDIQNANMSMEVDLGVDVLPVRVFKNEIEEGAFKSDRLLSNEYNYFIQDIAKDKQLLSQLSIYNPKTELIEDVYKMKL